MATDTRLLEIQKSLDDQFPRVHPFSEPIRRKLACALYRQQRCEALLQQAFQAMHSDAWDRATVAQRSEFRANVRATRERIEALKALTNRLAKALTPIGSVGGRENTQ